MQPADPQAQTSPYLSWAAIAKALEEFKPPEVAIDHGSGEVSKTAWVFRGHKSTGYDLEPTIEREAQSKNMSWPALESLVSSEFGSRARMHLSALSVPEDDFSMLALMQHYSVPTRLLDFTYSPFVGLYFAIRNKPDDKCAIRIWAMDAEAVNKRFTAVVLKVEEEERRREGKGTSHRVSSAFDDARTEYDTMTSEIFELQERIGKLLSSPRTGRFELHRQGCVCAASPLAFNPRLASQQGVFLFSFAHGLSFKESLFKMMEPCGGWYKTFDIDAGAISDIEQRLFQMNIHEQSLFPDMEGLAGLIRQKIRLHWK
jgi:hypothetical protein